MNTKMQIDWDEKDGVIRVGKYSENRLRVYKTSTSPDWKVWTRKVAEENDIYLPYAKKDFNKAAAEMFGRAPTKMWSHYKKLAYKQFVMPYRHLLIKTNFRPGRIDLDALRRVQDNKEKLEEVYNDGLHNLIPVVAYSGKSPQELKNDLKGAWKTIAKNSANKNRALARKVNPKLYSAYCGMPTTLLSKYADKYSLDALKHLEVHHKGKWAKANEIYHVARLVEDTKNMAAQLSKQFDPLWTPRRMKEEHDQMVKDINALRYPKTPFVWLEDVQPKQIEVGEYTVLLLDNACSIAEEGSAMGHCVGSYADYSSRGKYLVYSVTKGGERGSTIGLNVVEKKNGDGYRYHFSQHYGKYNTTVTNKDEASIPDYILKILNTECQK